MNDTLRDGQINVRKGCQLIDWIWWLNWMDEWLDRVG